MDKKNEFHTGDTGVLSFDPFILVKDVLKRLAIIALAAVMVGVGTYIIKDATYTPNYRTSAVFVVTTKGSSTTVYNNLNSTSNVATLFTELLSSSLMRKTVMEEIGVSALDATITTSQIPNTNLISMTVTSSNPRTAFLTAQALISTHEELTYTIVDSVIMEVLQAPTVPTNPSNSANATGQMKRMGMLAALATAVLLGVHAFMRDTVRSKQEAQKKLDCDCFGEIPHEKKYKTLSALLRRRKTSILINNPTTGFAYVESIRKLRHRVEKHMGSGKVLMITSLLENEGKSTVAVNLALSLAKKHERVLLIDCDLRKPACHSILDHKKFSSGIKEVLQGKATLADSVLNYQSSKLYIMLAKKGDDNTADLISSERMEILLEWARKNFDYVVLDLPPMAAAADAEAIANLADASLLVVRQGEALTPGLNKSIAALENHRARLLGCVLNNVHTTRLSSGSYGGYHKYNYYRSYGSNK